MNKIAIATPTYNEARNIKILIAGLGKACGQFPDIAFTLLVIDDNSPDGTAQAAKDAAKKLPIKNLRVQVLNRSKKEGVGRAYIHGLSELLKQDFDYIIQIDADLQHNPKYIKDFVQEAQKGRDFVTASRYMKGGKIVGWGLQRRILSLGGNIYTRMFMGNSITDYTNGLNMFSADLLRKIDVNSLGSAGYGFFIELKYRALQHAKDFSQIPITLTGRQHGQSKLSKNTILVNLLLVPRLRFSGSKKSTTNK